MKQKLGIALMLVAIGLLIPGVTKPVLILNGTVDKAELVELGMKTLADSPDIPNFMTSLVEQLVSQLDITGELPAYNKTRSILGTVQELYDGQQWLVAFLIALFSIIVPVVKSLLMIFSSMMIDKASAVSDKIVRFISKWSMADVFVVAIIVAFLAANATQHTEKLFSLEAQFGEGFYYFLGYCLLSILSTQLMSKDSSK